MPISGCHDLPLATFNLPSRVFRHGCRRAGCPERRWGGFFHTLSRGQHMPPQQALKTNGNSAPIKPVSFPSSGRVKESPKPKTRTPRAAAPAAACVAGRSRGQHMPPQQLPVQPQKNPPIPPQTPRAAAPPAAAVGWPVHRPTHAPATTLKTNGNSAPIKPVSFPSSERVKESPKPKTRTPRAAAPAAACVAGRSRGQHMPPQQLPVQPQKNPPTPPKPLVLPLPRRHAWLAAPAANTCPRNSSQSNRKRIPQPPPKPLVLPLLRPTHAPATSPQNKRQQRPH